MMDNATSGRQLAETASSTALNAVVPGLGKVVKPLNTITDKLTKKEDGTYKSQFAETASFLNPLTTVNRLAEGITTGSAGDIVDSLTFGFGSKVFGLKTNAEKAAEKRKQAEIAANVNNASDNLRDATSNTKFQSQQYRSGTKSVKTKYKMKYEKGTSGINSDDPKNKAKKEANKKLPTKKETTLPLTPEEEQKLRVTSDYDEYNSDEVLKAGGVKKKYRSTYNPNVSKEDVAKRLKELDTERDYMKNWVDKRKSTNPKIQQELEAVKKSKINNLDLLSFNVQEKAGDKAGAYDDKYKDLTVYNNQIKNRKYTNVHEMSHAADVAGTKLTPSEVSLIKKHTKLNPNFRKENKDYDVPDEYYENPTEIKARISVLRRIMNVKPDEVVTKERLQKALKDNGKEDNIRELQNTIDSEDGILDLINQLGSVDKKTNKTIAKHGIKEVKLKSKHKYKMKC